jgi:hypothetical protein
MSSRRFAVAGAGHLTGRPDHPVADLLPVGKQRCAPRVVLDFA